MSEKKIIDITGIELQPGDPENCKGNGEHVDANGAPIECCCDECDHFALCYKERDPDEIIEELEAKIKEAEKIIHERQNRV
ncbi:MAG: hypothetical protein IKT34_00670 [Clostridia bacterium]|nr:hypothetical protein [Clostridia bacterium]